MFGANKPAFGATSNSAFGQSSIFGAASNPQTQPSSSLFGQQSSGLSGTNKLFTGNQMNTLSWGSTSITSNGTSLAFNPPITTEIMQRSGQPSQVNAKHMCITAMKEYQDKSLEELRLEDYSLNRRGPSTPAGGTSMFSASSTAKPFQFGSSQMNGTTSIFGQASKPTNTLFGTSTCVSGSNNMLFGGTATQSAFGQTSQGGLLGLKPQFGTATTPSIFGSTPASQSTGFSFGQTNQTTSVFGAKPLFGTTSATATGTSLFGTAQATSQLGNTGFSFGQQQQQNTGLGASTSFFGQSNQATSAAKPTLFGTQPTTGTGLMFGSSSTGIFGGAKPAGTTSVFGAPASGLTGLQGSQQQTGFTFGSPLGTTGGLRPAGTTSLFGANTAASTSTALKPGGLFGSGTPTGFTFGTGLNNQPTAFSNLGTTSSAGTLFGQPATNSLTAKKPFGFGTPNASGVGTFGFSQPSTGTSLFGAPTAATGFGLGTGATSGSLFGQTNTGFGLGQKPLQNIPAGSAFGSGFGLGASSAPIAGSFGSSLFSTNVATQGLGSVGVQPIGSSLMGLGSLNATGSALGLGSSDQLAQSIKAQQQVLEVVRSMPYGQSSLFRYLNLPSNPASNSDSKSQVPGAITTNTSGAGNIIVPAKYVATVFAERHRAAGLLAGSSPTGTGSNGSRVSGFRRPANSNARLLQVANRNKLFSGFCEEDALTASDNHNSPLSSSLRRTASLGPTVLSSILSPVNNNGNTSNFFVKRGEWKHLHLPENVRNSILERSNTITDELNQLAESTLDTTAHSDVTRDVSTQNKQFNPSTGDIPLKEVNKSSLSSLDHSTLSNIIGEKLVPVTNESSVKLLNAVTNRTDSPLNNRIYQQKRIDDSITRVRDALQGSIDERNTDSVLSSPSNITYGDISVLKSPNCDQHIDGDTTDWDQSNYSKPNTAITSNPSGVILTKPGYYTLPTLDELAEMVVDGEKCLVEDFVVGRRLYGHILFPGITDVYGLNLDNIVHIRRREVVVYPDDDKKPPIGTSLNKRAEVCLESIWPTDKSTREPIKSAERLALMHFEERLEKATRRMDARFIEYRPESGSWVFEVKHFSKYRLDDSDEGEGDDCDSDSLSKSQKTLKTTDIKAKCLFDSNQSIDDEEFNVIDQSKKHTALDSDQETIKDYQLKPYMSMRIMDPQFDQQSDFYYPQIFRTLPSCPTYDGISLYEDGKLDQRNDLPQSLHLSIMETKSQLDIIHSDNFLMTLYPYENIAKLCPESLNAGTNNDNYVSLTSNPSHWIVDAGLWHGHSIRPSFGCSRFPEFHSLVLVCPSSYNKSSGETHFEQTDSLTLFTLSSPIELFDEDLLNSALATSIRITQTSNSLLQPPCDHCPLWRPVIGLAPLESYTRILNCDPLTNMGMNFHESMGNERCSARLAGFRRIFSLCQALWGRHPQEAVAEAMTETESDPDKIFNSKFANLDFPILPENDQTWNDECISNEVYRNYNIVNYPINRYREMSGMRSLARKQAVSEWIRTQSFPWLKSKLESLGLAETVGLNEVVTDSYQPFSFSKLCPDNFDSDILAQGVFACLVSGESGAACRLAIVCKMPALASLIAQSSAGDLVVRRGLQHQLNKWHEIKFDQHIPINMLRVYCLLAGITEVPHPSDSSNISVLAELDWIQAFGAHIWYICDYQADLGEILLVYSNAWHFDQRPNTKHGVPRPSPPTFDKLLDPTHSVLPVKDYPINKETKGPNPEIRFRDWPRDTAYHLLELCHKQSHSLQRTLDPCSFSRRSSSTCVLDRSNLLDWAVSWHLWRFLLSYGYHHFYDDFYEDFSQISTRVCNEFATQLESAGLWEWSVFVLLHIENAKTREAFVKCLIGRHVSLVLPSALLNNSNKNSPSCLSGLDFMSREVSLVPTPLLTKAETFVVNRLGVPVRWIHEAKAILARHRLKTYLHTTDINAVSQQRTLTSTEDRSQFCIFAMLEASHWFAAGRIQAADEVLSKYILPELILHTNISPYSAFQFRFESVYSALGRRIAHLLEPYDSLAENSLPNDFHSGVGVYRSFSELLCLVDEFTNFCKQSSSTLDSVYSPIRKRIKEDPDLSKLDHLASILSKLKSKVASVTEEINLMKINSFLEKVVRTEMAAVCIHLASAFIAASCLGNTKDERNPPANETINSQEQGTLNYLEHQLVYMTKLGLPADYRLKELRAVAEIKLSLGVV
ncbi:Nuclear pore complex protein [Schistosoma japonicum]|uniref:Nuclear pore complex protein Nup98-Nup96 n=1 Tax=Schistosoma japonicum TaxID=6182 RepID=A0A4Z2DSB0_SCHJA|nr:Nuclear pore complex protein [Schistosoma japonicum]